MIHVAGFMPWDYKYTTTPAASTPECRPSGGTPRSSPASTPTWTRDASGLSAMANASFFQHYPLADRYPQNPKPTRESLTARGLLDAQGRIEPRRYAAHYVGDYDAAAWLYRELPRCGAIRCAARRPCRGRSTRALAMRFPLGMA